MAIRTPLIPRGHGPGGSESQTRGDGEDSASDYGSVHSGSATSRLQPSDMDVLSTSAPKGAIENRNRFEVEDCTVGKWTITARQKGDTHGGNLGFYCGNWGNDWAKPRLQQHMLEDVKNVPDILLARGTNQHRRCVDCSIG